MAYLTIRPESFVERLSLSDYSIYRNGLILMIKNNKHRTGYVLKMPAMLAMLQRLGFPTSQNCIDALLSGNSQQTIWRIPTDEMIIQYCINQGFIDHPYEEYR